MFSGVHDVDWSSMYCGSEVPALLEALRSPDADERGRALQEFYGVIHHQGDVYYSTTASLPFLFELAGDPGTPDRFEIVALLVSIGEHAVKYYVGTASMYPTASRTTPAPQLSSVTVRSPSSRSPRRPIAACGRPPFLGWVYSSMTGEQAWVSARDRNTARRDVWSCGCAHRPGR